MDYGLTYAMGYWLCQFAYWDAVKDGKLMCHCWCEPAKRRGKRRGR